MALLTVDADGGGTVVVDRAAIEKKIAELHVAEELLDAQLTGVRVARARLEGALEIFAQYAAREASAAVGRAIQE